MGSRNCEMLTLSGKETPLFLDTTSFLERGVSVIRRSPTRFRNALPLLCLVGMETGVDGWSCVAMVGVVDCLDANVGVMK